MTMTKYFKEVGNREVTAMNKTKFKKESKS